MAPELGGAPLDPALYGWKAHYLGTLLADGYEVPRGFALGVDEDVTPEDFASWFGADTALAVRSSALVEDSLEHSYAGYFSTRLDVRGVADVESAISDLRDEAAPHELGVVVQQMIDAAISGVAFSIDPATYESGYAAVSWVDGPGGGLVSGTESGSDILVEKASAAVVRGDWYHGDALLKALLTTLDQLATNLLGPVDIEWCVERGSGTLYLLQVRPVVLPAAKRLQLDGLDRYAQLPSIVTSHPKLQLRRKALDWNIPMTPAQITVANARVVPVVRETERSRTAAGSSVVLLHPFTVGKRVVREFAKVNDCDVDFFTSECRRYSVRQYPSFDDRVATETRVLNRGLAASTFAAVIEQEIWDADITGIVRKLDDGYIVEVALGHFVPKGYVQTSTYLANSAFDVVWRNVANQRVAYHFINGHVVREEDPEGAADLEDADVHRVLRTLGPLLNTDDGLALEFGLTQLGPEGVVYLIDAAESDDPGLTLSSDSFGTGVVSHGRSEGLVVDLRDEGLREDLNAHFFQRIEGAGPSEPTIFLAHRASVDLLPLLYACPPGCGFVFEEASLLAHFAVVMRERGVPGAVVAAEDFLILAKAPAAVLDTTMSPVTLAVYRHESSRPVTITEKTR